VRNTAYRLAIESGAADITAWLHRRRAVILTYHGVVRDPPTAATRGLHKIFVTAEQFHAQMVLLKARYTVLSLRELVERLERGETAERLAAVTFDDGWRSTRTLAAPILHSLGIPATVFLATGLIGTARRGLWTQRIAASLGATPSRSLALGDLDMPADTPARRAAAMRAISGVLKALPPAEREERVRELIARYGEGAPLGPELEFMSWQEVGELAALGIDCGAHTVDHEILSSLSEEEAVRQILRSREQVEDATKVPCGLFAYPNGSERDFSDAHVRTLAAEKFLAAVTQIPGRNSSVSDRYRLRRIDVALDHTLHTFLAELDALRHW
jgi:peptidoglycan/xylan/chitin deacetylase (PgdA/CDA1 family)